VTDIIDECACNILGGCFASTNGGQQMSTLRTEREREREGESTGVVCEFQVRELKNFWGKSLTLKSA